MSDKLLSIIIPIYNTEEYLSDCIESVLNQTYRNLEVILVDDGSTDNSLEICNKYAEQDCRVKVFHKENGGISDARNYGLNHISGDYFAFLDSDDLCMPGMYEELINACVQFDTPMAICNLAYYYNDNICEIDQSRHSANISLTDSHEMIKNVWKSAYDSSRFTAVVTKCFKTSFFKEIIKFKKGIMCEDDQLSNRLYLPYYPIASVDKSLYLYRMNTNSITHRPFSEKNCVVLTVMKERAELFWENGFKLEASKVAKLYCELYIEYYYRAHKAKNTVWVTKHADDFRKMRLKAGLRDMLKHQLRYTIFSASPSFYGEYVLKNDS